MITNGDADGGGGIWERLAGEDAIGEIVKRKGRGGGTGGGYKAVLHEGGKRAR